MDKVIGAVRSKTMSLLFWALVLSGLGLVFVVGALPVAQRRAAIEERMQTMTEENQGLKARNQKLELERVALKNDPFYIEKIARRELNMRRPGEMQVHIVPAHMERAVERSVPRVSRPTTGIQFDLNRFHATFAPIIEDEILRQAALILGGVVFIAGIVLFGRECKSAQDD